MSTFEDLALEHVGSQNQIITQSLVSGYSAMRQPVARGTRKRRPPMRPLGLINQSHPLPSSLADPRVKAASEYMQIIAESRPSPCGSRENHTS